MPAVKKLEDRAFMAPKPEPEKIDYTKLSHFDTSATFVYNLLLPESLHKSLAKVEDKSTFVSQALLDLILAARGIKCTEERKPSEDWYKTVRYIRGKASFKFEGVRQTVKPSVPVQSTIDRKFIKLTDTETVPLYLNASKCITSVDVVIRLHNELARLADYHQLSISDAYLQAVERALYVFEDAQAKAAINPNAVRLSRTIHNWDVKHRTGEKETEQMQKLAEYTAETLEKRAAKQSSQDNKETK